MSFNSQEASPVKPSLLTVVNSHKILRARQSTFTPEWLQRLRQFGVGAACGCASCSGGGGGGAIGVVGTTEGNEDGEDDDCEKQLVKHQLQLKPRDIQLPDFACELRLPDDDVADVAVDLAADTRRLAVLADCFLLLLRAGPRAANAVGDLAEQAEFGLCRASWTAVVAVADALATEAALCLRGVRLEAESAGYGGIRLVWPAGHGGCRPAALRLEPLTCSPATLLELLLAASQLDSRGLLAQLPPERGASTCGDSLTHSPSATLTPQHQPAPPLLLLPLNSQQATAAGGAAHQTQQPQPQGSPQAQALLQSPMGQQQRSPRFFKRKFDSLWAFFGTGGAPVAQPSRMFYAALSLPELESCLHVARKPRARRQKLWSVLHTRTMYFFKQRSAACNAEFEVDLLNLTGLEVTEDAAAKEAARRDPLSPSGLRTMTLRFSNSKKCIYLTPLDKFDLRRWVDGLERLLNSSGDIASAGGRGSQGTLDEDGLSRLQARRLSGLSNSFHNLSSAGASRSASPPPGAAGAAGGGLGVGGGAEVGGAGKVAGKDGRLGVPSNLNNREMMASCNNLDELSGRQSPVRNKFSPVGPAALLSSHQDGAMAGMPMPIITVNCSDDLSLQRDCDDEEQEEEDNDCQLKKLEIWRSSSESIDQLTPEEIAELRRRRISTEIQLQSLQSEIKKREEHLSAKQLQALNVQMSDLYEDIQELSTTLAKVQKLSGSGGGFFASFKKKSF